MKVLLISENNKLLEIAAKYESFKQKNINLLSFFLTFMVLYIKMYLVKFIYNTFHLLIIKEKTYSLK